MTPTLGRRYLVDTNVLIASVNRGSDRHQSCRELLEDGLKRGILFVIAQQNLLEFIAVMTRAYKVSVGSAYNDAAAFAGRFEVIVPQNSTFELSRRLARRASKSAYPFDVYLVATMFDNNVDRLITANAKDFLSLGMKEIISV